MTTAATIHARQVILIKPRGEGDVLELELDTSPPTILRFVAKWTGGQLNWSPTKENT